MSDNIIQTSFASGELSPSIFARTDLSKYHSGAATMRNWFVDYRSGTSTRAGLEYINDVLQSNKTVRLIPFQFSSDISYVIEFGDFYCRFFYRGGAVLETAVAITAVSNSNPMQITAPGHTYSIGDTIFVKDIIGVNPANARYYQITGITGNVLTLSTVRGVPVNSLAYGTYVSGGTVSRVYTITSPYASGDLALLKFVQDQNVMTLTNVAYDPYTLTATGPTSWTFTQIVFATTISPPTGLGSSVTAAGAANYSYVVTAVDGNNQESAASAALAVAGAVNVTTTAGTITVNWTASTGAVLYNVYRTQLTITNAVPAGQAYGFQGQVTAPAVTFVDSNIVPDYSQTPPILKNPFTGGNHPGCCCFFQQRIYYAGSNPFPTTFYASQPGLYNNFNTAIPVVDDCSIEAKLVSLQVNAIKSMVPMPGGLIMLTSQGAWQINAGGTLGASSAVTPINVTANIQAYNGAGDIPPIVANHDILYIQSKGTIVRALTYNIYATTYTGADISVLSNHLFFEHRILEWAYAEEPYKIVWCVREDGILLSLTYVKEQEIFGWARHDTLGLFKSVCSVREGQSDAVYVVVKRYIGGAWWQSVERMDDRTFVYGAEDSFCVDSGLESALNYPQAGIMANVSTGTVNFTADANVFVSGDVGKILRMDGGIATITSYVSATQLIGTWTQSPTITLPNDPNNTPVPATQGNWSLTSTATVFYGLDYLEGQTVSILADGGVVAPQVVTNGRITLANPASKVVAGLAYVPQLQTMPLDTGTPTIQGKRKNVNALTIKCVQSRGLLAGRFFTTDSLVQLKELSPSVVLGEPIPLITGDERIVMDSTWDVLGQICIQQNDPLPATVLGVVPEISIGDN